MILLKDLSLHLNKEVTVKAWMHNKRGSGKIYFLQIRDGSDFVQAVVEKSQVSEDIFTKAEQLTQESAISITGLVTKHPKKEEYELQVQSLEIIHLNESDYPISNKEHGIEFLFDQRHLWLRSKRQWAIQRVRNEIINSTYDFFQNNNFIKIDAPIFTPNACEGTTTLYEVDHFGTPMYLSQSGQLYIESAIFAHGRVFDFGPVFRAEKHKTRRHLNEFWMMDAEMAFATHTDNLEVQEKLIKHIVASVLKNCEKELVALERDLAPLKDTVSEKFPVMTHKEAVDFLRSQGSEITEHDDLGATDETILTENRKTPIFIEKFPAEVKAFYMKRAEDDPTKVLGADLLAPEGYGEIIGGSERETDYQVLKDRIIEEKLNLDDFSWYLDLRKYGSVPHSGFGYGLERLVVWICGLHHVRESIPFPRTIVRMKP